MPGDEEDEIIDSENPRPSPGAQLPCAAALEFLADVYEKEREREGVLKAVEVRLYFSCWFSLRFLGASPAFFSSIFSLLDSEEDERADGRNFRSGNLSRTSTTRCAGGIGSTGFGKGSRPSLRGSRRRVQWG